jgi:hypothetical protein
LRGFPNFSDPLQRFSLFYSYIFQYFNPFVLSYFSFHYFYELILIHIAFMHLSHLFFVFNSTYMTTCFLYRRIFTFLYQIIEKKINVLVISCFILIQQWIWGHLRIYKLLQLIYWLFLLFSLNRQSIQLACQSLIEANESFINLRNLFRFNILIRFCKMSIIIIFYYSI